MGEEIVIGIYHILYPAKIVGIGMRTCQSEAFVNYYESKLDKR